MVFIFINTPHGYNGLLPLALISFLKEHGTDGIPKSHGLFSHRLREKGIAPSCLKYHAVRQSKKALCHKPHPLAVVFFRGLSPHGNHHRDFKPEGCKYGHHIIFPDKRKNDIRPLPLPQCPQLAKSGGKIGNAPTRKPVGLRLRYQSGYALRYRVFFLVHPGGEQKHPISPTVKIICKINDNPLGPAFTDASDIQCNCLFFLLCCLFCHLLLFLLCSLLNFLQAPPRSFSIPHKFSAALLFQKAFPHSLKVSPPVFYPTAPAP